MSSSDASAWHGRAVRGVFLWAPLSTLVTLLYVTPVFLGLLRFRGPVGFLPVAAAVAALAGLTLYAVLRCCLRSIRLVLRPLGYPDRHWRDLCKNLRFAILVELIGSTLAASMTAYAVRGAGPLADDLVAWASLADAVLLFLMLQCVGGVGEVLRHANVVPYFDKRVGEIDTFCGGEFVARHLAEFDELARSFGAAPLSGFGWNDDMDGEPLVWHEASGGRETVDALLAHLRGEEPARDDFSGIVDDLTRIAHALGRADERGIRFCLLLRHATATNGMEWEARKGTCF